MKNYEEPNMEVIELVAREVFMVQSDGAGDNVNDFENDTNNDDGF